MKLNKFRGIIWALVLCLAMSVVYCPVTFSEPDNIPAFPGAEGGGMWTTGARASANPEVYHVTKLSDDGSRGTFRDAVSEPNRVIVFDVAGNIELQRTLTIKSDNLTILGQTAPGDGICFKDYNVYITGNNVILRYLRFRMGDDNTVEDDSIGGRGIKNIIIDHCSMSWSTDECASFYENENFTMQWCIVSESLKRSVHAKDNHGYAGIWGGTNATYHHNLIAHHDSRNPRIATKTDLSSYKNITATNELTDLRNNVLYNWGGNSAYGGENGAPINIVNCYYKYGPATDSGKRSRIYQLSTKTNAEDGKNIVGWGPELYVDGNYVHGNSDFTSNNTKGVDNDGNTKEYHIYTPSTLTADAKTVHERYINDYPITTQTAEQAYESVLSNAGVNINRDSVDTRVIKEVKEGKSTYGQKGIINSPADVGGYPELNGKKAKDSDNDGIPNEWEDMNGLDKFSKADGLSINPATGYLYIEDYANTLADGSYIRNVDYDPHVPDYEDEPEPSFTTGPNPTSSPIVTEVSKWTAVAADANKKAGAELMPGLELMFDVDRTLPNAMTYTDGTKHNFAITADKLNGGWDLDNKIAKGSAIKFTAPVDGVFTLYGYGVSAGKNFYVMPHGADTVEDAIYSFAFTEASEPLCVSIPMKTGDIYYYYLDGSKFRYQIARFDQVVPGPTSTPAPATATPVPLDNYIIKDLNATETQTTFNVTKNKASDLDCSVIVCVYDQNSLIKDVKFDSIPANTELSATIPFDIEIGASQGEKVKVFVWQSNDNIEPLAEIAEIVK